MSNNTVWDTVKGWRTLPHTLQWPRRNNCLLWERTCCSLAGEIRGGRNDYDDAVLV